MSDRTMIRRLKIKVRDAAAETYEERSWTCPTCTTMTEPGAGYEPYCWYCGSYWRDVESGIFDD